MTFDTRVSKGSMRTRDADGKETVRTMKIWARGGEDSYVKFLSPARDKGVKYLKRGDNLYMYLPRTEKVVKISGHMLRQSLMDSDFSYEDMLESRKLLDSYTATLEGETTEGGQTCWVVVLTAKKPEVTYHRRKLWIARQTHVAMKSELYARSGLLLKVMTQSEILTHRGRHYPKRTTIWDRLKKGSSTVLELTDIEFDVHVPSRLFSRRNLARGD